MRLTTLISLSVLLAAALVVATPLLPWPPKRSTAVSTHKTTPRHHHSTKKHHSTRKTTSVKKTSSVKVASSKTAGTSTQTAPTSTSTVVKSSEPTLPCSKKFSGMTLGLLGYGSDESHYAGILSDATVTDRFGADAPFLFSDDTMAAQKFDFWLCNSTYYEGADAQYVNGFRGQLTPTQNDGSKGSTCLTSGTSDLTLYSQSVTLSSNCDIDTKDYVLYNLWSMGTIRDNSNLASLVGPKVNNADYIPGSWSLLRNQTQQDGHTPVQLIYSSDDDRRRSAEKRQDDYGMPFWITLS